MAQATNTKYTNPSIANSKTNYPIILTDAQSKAEGSLTIDIPSELNNASLQLIAYTQEKENCKILGADQKAL